LKPESIVRPMPPQTILSHERLNALRLNISAIGSNRIGSHAEIDVGFRAAGPDLESIGSSPLNLKDGYARPG
jgi:hypothetical protein